MIDVNKINQNNQYSLQNPKITKKYSTLKMRETIQSSGNVGYLIPLTIHECLPSERVRLSHNFNAQFTPFVTNILHEINAEILTYFVPYRIIWNEWEKFITGCDEENDLIDGTIEVDLPKISIEQYNKAKAQLDVVQKDNIENLPKKIDNICDEINVVFAEMQKEIYPSEEPVVLVKGSYNLNWEGTQGLLWRAGLATLLWAMSESGKTPIGIERENIRHFFLADANNGSNPPTRTKLREDLVQMALVAIDKVLNKENVGSLPDYYGFPISLETTYFYTLAKGNNQTGGGFLYDWATQYPNLFSKEAIELGAKKIEKMPISLNYRAYNKIYNDWIRQIDWEPRRDVEDLSLAKGNYAYDIFTRARRYQLRGAMPKVPINLNNMSAQIISDVTPDISSQEYLQIYDETGKVRIRSASTDGTPNGNVTINKNAEINGEGNWDILDMVTPAGLLNYYMANARIKPRYSNQLLARWGVEIQDARFQYAQILSANKIQISQNGITQTAPQVGESTLQGNITGQAWGSGGGNTKFYAPEHGVLISLLLMKPANAYELGYDAQYYKTSKFDYPTPELIDTPDVPIYASELAPNAEEDVILGWKGIYDEYRTKFNKVTGLLRPSIRSSLGAKTLARFWDDEITMQDLIKINAPMDRIKQFIDQPDFTFIVQSQFKNTVPIPYVNDPRILI